MLLNIEHIRQLNARNEEMSYMIIQKSIERFFYDLLRNYGVLNQNYILVDSSYLPYQYLSIPVIQKIIILFEQDLGYNIIIQKTDNRKDGYQKGDLIQIFLFDPLNYSEYDVDVTTNCIISKTIYSTFTGYNNLEGNRQKTDYLSCGKTQYLLSTVNDD